MITLTIVDGKDYLPQVKNLIRAYVTELNRDLSFQHLEEELANPGEKYTAPKGEILVALDDHGQVAGMVAYYGHSDTRCEMKRLYVSPPYRGSHLGDTLVSQIVSHAQKAGYTEMVLDTIAPLQAAIHLYHKFGFAPCDAYYNNPMEDVIYMRKDLT